jgi:hypothetical protein
VHGPVAGSAKDLGSVVSGVVNILYHVYLVLKSSLFGSLSIVLVCINTPSESMELSFAFYFLRFHI